MASGAWVVIGKLVARFRKQRKMKQDALAAILGIDQATLSRIETGSNPPSPKTLARIRELLGETLGLSTMRRVVKATPAMRALLIGPDMVLDTISDYALENLSERISDMIGLSAFEIDNRLSRNVVLRHNAMALAGELIAFERIGKTPRLIGPALYTHRLIQFHIIDGVIVRDILWRAIDEEEYKYLGGRIAKELKEINDEMED